MGGRRSQGVVLTLLSPWFRHSGEFHLGKAKVDYMNEQPRRPFDTEKVLATVRDTAKAQSSDVHRENYLRSCEAHGGELAIIADKVRKEFIHG